MAVVFPDLENIILFCVIPISLNLFPQTFFIKSNSFQKTFGVISKTATFKFE